MEEKYSKIIIIIKSILIRKGYGGDSIGSHDLNYIVRERKEGIRRWIGKCIGV